MRSSGRRDVHRHAPASTRSRTSSTTYAIAYGSFMFTTDPFCGVKLNGLRRIDGDQLSPEVLQPAASRTSSAAHTAVPPRIAIVAIDDAIVHYKEYLFSLMSVCGRIARHRVGHRARFERPRAGWPYPSVVGDYDALRKELETYGRRTVAK